MCSLKTWLMTLLSLYAFVLQPAAPSSPYVPPPSSLYVPPPSSPYVPPSWAGICFDKTSSSKSPERIQPVVLVDLRCNVSKSQPVQWKLKDLRDWTIYTGINNQTTGLNRTIIYNVTVTCETGANVSISWPMRVAGLIELHVTFCHLLDKYGNFLDPIDNAIGDDMKVLEIRHSIWIVPETNPIKLNFNKLTSEYDCGQDSSLEMMITCNVSDIDESKVDSAVSKQSNIENNNNNSRIIEVNKEHVDSISDLFTSGPATPGDRVIKDANVFSEHMNKEKQENTTKRASQKNQDEEMSSSKSPHTAEQNYIETMKKIVHTDYECSYEKLKVLDESIAPLTPRHHFETMLQGAYYPLLQNMNHSFIGLTELPEQLVNWRLYFPKLTDVDLSHNSISEVKIPSFSSTSGIGVVKFNLRYNNITYISMDILKSWAEVEDLFVDIRDNPIHCGCEMSTLLPYLVSGSEFKDDLAPYEYVKYLQCETPEDLRGYQLNSLTVDSLQCSGDTSHIDVVIVLCVLMAMLIIIIIVITRFKVEIRILLYTRLHVRLPCDVAAQRHTKTFDAFVSYSNADYAWVLENLVNFLEKYTNENPYITTRNSNHNNSSEAANGHNSFRLCIHQRDFVPGKAIFDNIVDSINSSRHTIIVLSPSYIKSQWAMEELRQAYRQSLAEKTRHLMIIRLEKVSKEEMDPLVSLCCKNFTYLDATDSLFKDRLVFSLTTKSGNGGRANRPAHKESNVPTGSNQSEANVYGQNRGC